MTTIGLEQPSRSIRRLVDETIANTLRAANELDVLVDGDAAALEAIERAQRDSRRIDHDLGTQLEHSWRNAPDRERLLRVVRALDDVLDTIEAVAWSWSRWPQPALTALPRAVRDLARVGARAVAADAAQLEACLATCESSEQEARRQVREARAWLLAAQPDVRVAIAGETLVCRVERAVRAGARLRARLRRLALA